MPSNLFLISEYMCFEKSTLEFSRFYSTTKISTLNTYPTTIFSVLKMLSAMSAAYIQVHFRLNIFIEANNMNPDQTP